MGTLEHFDWVQIGGAFTSHSTPDTRPKVPQGYNPHDVQLKVTAKTPGLNPFHLLHLRQKRLVLQ